MHRKPVFALAGVFLAIALIVPPVILFTQIEQDFEELISGWNPGRQTSGNVTTLEQFQARQLNIFIIALTIEVVFVLLFIVTAYYGFKHIRPYH